MRGGTRRLRRCDANGTCCEGEELSSRKRRRKRVAASDARQIDSRLGGDEQPVEERSAEAGSERSVSSPERNQDFEVGLIRRVRQRLFRAASGVVGEEGRPTPTKDRTGAGRNDLGSPEISRSRPGDSKAVGQVAAGSSNTQGLVWRAVFLGGALAILFVLLPSYLALPLVGRSRLVILVRDNASWRIAASESTPLFSAGIAASKGHTLALAVPRDRQVVLYEVLAPSFTSEFAPAEVTPSAPELRLERRGQIEVPGGPVVLSAIPGSDLVAVLQSGSAELGVLDLNSKELTATTQAGNRPVAIALSPSGVQAAVLDAESSDVALIDLPSRSTRSVAVSGRPRYAVFVGEDLLAVATDQPSLQLVDPQRATQRNSLELDFVPGPIGTCRGRLLAADPSRRSLTILDPADPQRRTSLPLGGQPSLLECASEGSVAVATIRPRAVEFHVLPVVPEAGEPEPQEPASTASLRVDLPMEAAFSAEITPGVMAFAGPEPTPAALNGLLVGANLAAVAAGGILTGYIARRRLGAHALALAGIILLAYWVVFRGARPETLSEVLVYLGLPVAAAAGTGTWLSKFLVSRKKQKEADEATSPASGGMLSRLGSKARWLLGSRTSDGGDTGSHSQSNDDRR